MSEPNPETPRERDAEITSELADLRDALLPLVHSLPQPVFQFLHPDSIDDGARLLTRAAGLIREQRELRARLGYAHQ